jgi:hypothetical protein
MRGRLTKAAAAASFCSWALSVEGLRKALRSSSGGELGISLVLVCVAADNSVVFSRILVLQRLLEKSLLAASGASAMVPPADQKSDAI